MKRTTAATIVLLANVRLSADMHRALLERCEREGRSVSDVVKAALSAFLVGDPCGPHSPVPAADSSSGEGDNGAASIPSPRLRPSLS